MAGFSLLHYFVYSSRAISLSPSEVAGAGLGAGDEAVRWNIGALPALMERTTWPSLLNLPWLPPAPAEVHTPYLSLSARPYLGAAGLPSRSSQGTNGPAATAALFSTPGPCSLPP